MKKAGGNAGFFIRRWRGFRPLAALNNEGKEC